MIIISIDPGYERLGIAVIQKKPKEKEVLLFSECFKTSAKLPHHQRLSLIGKHIKGVIEKYKPEMLATEKLFFSNNQKTALLVSQALGVIVYEAALSKTPVFYYKPIQIKVAVTGYGKSDKEQVTSMVDRLIKLPAKKRHDDEYDAIAVGLTHLACRHYKGVDR